MAEIHLAGELRLNGADLEVDCHQDLDEVAIKPAIDAILLLAQFGPVPPVDEKKP